LKSYFFLALEFIAYPVTKKTRGQLGFYKREVGSLSCYSGRNLDHVSGYFPKSRRSPRSQRPNLVRSTNLVELSSTVPPETLTEWTEAFQLRPKRPF
jgi:hypothetical protein